MSPEQDLGQVDHNNFGIKDAVTWLTQKSKVRYQEVIGYLDGQLLSKKTADQIYQAIIAFRNDFLGKEPATNGLAYLPRVTILDVARLAGEDPRLAQIMDQHGNYMPKVVRAGIILGYHFQETPIEYLQKYFPGRTILPGVQKR